MLGLARLVCADENDVETWKWESPRHDYSIVVSAASDSLTLFHKTKELARYTLESSLDSIYWSPKETYVAFNNHYGHRGWAIWILSLKDGSVIRLNGKERSAKYDKYTDHGDLPDVLAPAKPQIIAVYPGYPKDTDRRGEGHITIIYGWKDNHTLKRYDEVVLDNLYEKEQSRLSIYSLMRVQESGLSVVPVSVEKTGYSGKPDSLPAEVVKVLGY